MKSGSRTLNGGVDDDGVPCANNFFTLLLIAASVYLDDKLDRLLTHRRHYNCLEILIWPYVVCTVDKCCTKCFPSTNQNLNGNWIRSHLNFSDVHCDVRMRLE